MALRVVEQVGDPAGYVPLNIESTLGQTSDSITSQEVSTEIVSRGYKIQEYAPVSPVPATEPVTILTLPTISRADAIKRGVDESLRSYSMATRCTRYGGCPVTLARWNAVAMRAAGLATAYLRAGSLMARAPSISPVPSLVSPSPVSPTAPWTVLSLGQLSPRTRGIGGDLYDLGQDVVTLAPVLPGWQPVQTQDTAPQQQVPEMTKWDWVTVISRAVQGGFSTIEAYANARAQRERAGQTATLTADQIKAIVQQAVQQNPQLDKAALKFAAAGAGGLLEPKGLPSWIIPAVLGGVVLAVVVRR